MSPPCAPLKFTQYSSVQHTNTIDSNMARGDSFFEGGGDGDRKRKRGAGNRQQQRDGASSRGGGRGGRGRGRGRGGATTTTANGKGKGRQREGSEEEEEDEEPGQRRRRGGDAASSDSDEVSLDGGNGNDNDNDGFDSAEEEEARETPAQKRLRLAKQYLDTLKAGQEACGSLVADWSRSRPPAPSDFFPPLRCGQSRNAITAAAGDIDAAELERDIIAERLQKDVVRAGSRAGTGRELFRSTRLNPTHVHTHSSNTLESCTCA